MGNLNSLQERLVYLLKNKGITSYQLSAETGVSEGTLSRILSGKTQKLRESTLKKLADYFKINEEWLRIGSGEMSHKPEKKASEEEFAELKKLIAANETLAEANKILAENYTRLMDYFKNEKGINI